MSENCDRCTMLEGLLIDAETANAELGRQLAGLELHLRRSGKAEVLLRKELAEQREEEPDAVGIREVCDHWKMRLGKSKRTKTPLTGKRAKMVRARLRERYTVDDLKKAIDGCAKFPYVGQGDRNATGVGKRYDDLELICRDEVQVEKFMALADEDQTPATSAPASPSPTPRPPHSGPTGVDAILDRLEGVKEARPGQWNAKCPAHDDRHASLSVGQGDKGAVLHCHAGCPADAIASAAGVEVTALFDPTDRVVPIKAAKPASDAEALPSPGEIDRLVRSLTDNQRLLDRILELRHWTATTLETLKVGFDGRRLTFPVYDEQGALVNVLRYLPRRIEGQPKLLAARGRPRNLWPAPEIIDEGELWIVEGEPDAISGWQLDLAAVAVPGANGWRSEWADRFRDRRVTICMDCDQPGRQLAARVHADLATIADARILDLEPEYTNGYDLSDALLEGADNEILTALSNAVITEQVAA